MKTVIKRFTFKIYQDEEMMLNGIQCYASKYSMSITAALKELARIAIIADRNGISIVDGKLVKKVEVSKIMDRM